MVDEEETEENANTLTYRTVEELSTTIKCIYPTSKPTLLQSNAYVAAKRRALPE